MLVNVFIFQSFINLSLYKNIYLDNRENQTNPCLSNEFKMKIKNLFAFLLIALIVFVVIIVGFYLCYTQIQHLSCIVKRIESVPDPSQCPSNRPSTAFFVGDGRIAMSTGGIIIH